MRWLLFPMLILLAGCGTAPGMLVISDLEYPDTIDVSESRIVELTFTIENTGEKPCVLQNIYSPDFWKVDQPGLTGNANTVFDMVIQPGAQKILPIEVYVWDADTIRDRMKRFAFTLNVLYNDDCPQAFVTREGLVWVHK